MTIMESDWQAPFEVFDSEKAISSEDKQSSAHAMAFELFRLKQTLMRRDVEEAIKLVDDALEEIWRHTDVYWQAKTAWKIYLEGNLPPEREPLNLIRKCLSDDAESTEEKERGV